MSQPSDSMDSTVDFYNQHADEFFRDTVGVDMKSLYAPFLNFVPEGGRILDAGCGSGRDTRAFLDRGFDVVAFDASTAMAGVAQRLTGSSVRVMRFQEMEFTEEFDGIWACASLLHVHRLNLVSVLERFGRALRSQGICYASFKHGGGERCEQGRSFTDMTGQALRQIVADVPSLEMIELWHTNDLRPGRGDDWLNVLLRMAENE